MDKSAIRRHMALAVAVLTAAGLLSLAGPGTATAEAASLCSGRKIRTLPFSTGSLQIYKKDGYVCALTLRKREGARTYMSVSVRAWRARPAVNKGLFRHHAGPVTAHVGHRRVLVKGTVGSASVSSGWIRL
ncbi:hypothetical protein [Streptomyces sp. NBC_00286]|uniref:hypothetical protein n=1 Tax=Streptomyces sp. NBC_00286 TaxID=2975701 RepID=UPI002E28484D|nr:hypothetical protein [Streptomyces sp. NBC_00286]